MNGWIKIHKQIAEHWVWKDAERLKWWLDLLLMANYDEQRKYARGHLIVISRGQIEASAQYLSERWGRERKTVLNYLRLLEEDGMIKRQIAYGSICIITICNYETYQCVPDITTDCPTDTTTDCPNRTISEQSTDCQNNIVNNCKTNIYNRQAQQSTDCPTDTTTDCPTDTNKEIKNIYSSSSNARVREKIVETDNICEFLKRNSQTWKESVQREIFRIKGKMPLQDELEEYFERYADQLRMSQVHSKDAKDIPTHFVNYLRVLLRNEKQNNNDENSRKSRQDARDEQFRASVLGDINGGW